MRQNSTQYNSDWCDLAIGLWEVGAILTFDSDHPLVVEHRYGRGERRGFALRDEGFSPYYFDLRTMDHPTKPGPLTPELVELSTRCLRYVELKECRRCEGIAGVPFAGQPFAKALADICCSGAEPITLDKDSGNNVYYVAALRRRISKETRRVLVVENVVTESAGSAIKWINTLRKAKTEIVDCLALIDRQRGGYERLRGNGCELHSVFGASQLFHFLSCTGKIKSGTNQRIQNYIRRAA